MIATPGLVSRDLVKGQALVRQTFEHFERLRFVRAVADVDIYRFRLEQRFHHPRNVGTM